MVIKPIHGNGGKAIFRVPESGDNLAALVEVFNQTWPEPHMVQPFLPNVAEADKRLVLIDGEYAGAINREAGEKEFAPRWARAQETRADLRRHRRDRRPVADRNQRHQPDRECGDRPVQRHRHRRTNLGCD